MENKSTYQKYWKAEIQFIEEIQKTNFQDFVYVCMEVMATCLEKLLSDRQKSRPPEKVGLPEEIIGKIALSVVRALDYLKEKHVSVEKCLNYF